MSLVYKSSQMQALSRKKKKIKESQSLTRGNVV